MIDVPALRARMRRLDELARQLGIEEERFRVTYSALLAHEAQAYREGLREAIHGLETARIALAAGLPADGPGCADGAA